MEEIKENNYVRTKEGYIVKLIHYGINKNINGKSCLFDGTIRDISNSVYDEDNFLFDSELKQYIVKHSSNIIDLIEKGDFVNGRLVLDVDYKNKNVCLLIPLTDTKANTNIMWYGYEDIKTVVTKEQFALAEYRLEE